MPTCGSRVDVQHPPLLPPPRHVAVAAHHNVGVPPAAATVFKHLGHVRGHCRWAQVLMTGGAAPKQQAVRGLHRVGMAVAIMLAAGCCFCMAFDVYRQHAALVA